MHEFITDRTDDERHRTKAQDLDTSPYVYREVRQLPCLLYYYWVLFEFRGFLYSESRRDFFWEKQSGTCERLSVTCY